MPIGTLRRWLTRPTPQHPSSSEAKGAVVDIPRYPPFKTGLPAASIEQLFETQAALILRIKHLLGLQDTQYNNLIAPCLNNLAAFVHLLPASEYHHHAGAGGLWRHSLETGLLALQFAERKIFTEHLTPQRKQQDDIRWRVASLLVGLLHDVGKPLMDISVTDRHGQARWSPFTQSLHTWTQSHAIDRYFIHWYPQRTTQHQQATLLAAQRLFPATLVQWLSDTGPHIVQALFNTLAESNQANNNPLQQLKIKADQASVCNDLQASRWSSDDERTGVPIERLLLARMQRLFTQGEWTINQEDSFSWYGNAEEEPHSLFVDWTKASAQLCQLLMDEKVYGIPQDANILAKYFIDRGLAEPHSSGTQYHSRWVQGNQWQGLLKFTDATLLMPDVLPPAMALPSECPLLTEGSESKTSPRNKTEGDVAEDNQLTEHSLQTSAPEEKTVLTSTTDVTQEEQLAPITTNSPHSLTQPLASQPIKPRRCQYIAVSEPCKPHEQAQSETTLSVTEQQLLRYIQQIATPLTWHANQLFIPYPDSIASILSPPEFLSFCAEQHWLVPHPFAPNRFTQQIAGVNGIVFNTEITATLAAQLGITLSDLPPAMPTAPQSSNLEQNTAMEEPTADATTANPPVTIHARIPNHTEIILFNTLVQELIPLRFHVESSSHWYLPLRSLRQAASQHGLTYNRLVSLFDHLGYQLDSHGVRLPVSGQE